MSVFFKFQPFVEAVAHGTHNLGTHDLHILLTNTVPNTADNVVDTTGAVCIVKATSNAEEIAAGNGYDKGGTEITVTASGQAGGVYQLDADPEVITAAGGAIGPFRYVVLYNNSAGAAATRPVIGWYDYAASITLNDGESLTVTFDAVDGVLQLE